MLFNMGPAITLALCLPVFVLGHARIKYPVPLGNPPPGVAGNDYNKPLNSDGSEFPCKGLHKSHKLSDPATAKTPFTAGSKGYFEILSHETPGVEGPLAAHSGGSCQASLSFDNGVTWKVLHSFEGGCPRGVKPNTNIATDPNQKFEFDIPKETKSGPALFAWTWIAATGNRKEYYMNCAAVDIKNGGTSVLNDLPDMWVGEMTYPGAFDVNKGQCSTKQGANLKYPNAGKAVTVAETPGIPFAPATPGKCVALGSTSGGKAGAAPDPKSPPPKNPPSKSAPPKNPPPKNPPPKNPPSKNPPSKSPPPKNPPPKNPPSKNPPSKSPPPKNPPSDLSNIRIDIDGKAKTCHCTCGL